MVRNGEDAKLYTRDEYGVHLGKGHTFQPVYTEMLFQIVRDYPGLPNVFKMKVSEIRFFYEGLRADLKHHTKPKG